MRLIALAVLFACACGAAVAPQRKIALLGVERNSGAHDRSLEAWLSRHVDKKFEVVASKLDDGLDEVDEDAIREVAERLGADAVVYGELSKKKRGKMKLTVRVHDGRTGQLIETHAIAIKAGKVVAKQERRFVRELLAMLPPPSKGALTSDKAIAKKKKKKTKSRARARDEESTESNDESGEREEREEPSDDGDDSMIAAEADEPERAEPESDEPEFEPAANAKPVKTNDEGQAIDEEMPTLFVKK